MLFRIVDTLPSLNCRSSVSPMSTPGGGNTHNTKAWRVAVTVLAFVAMVATGCGAGPKNVSQSPSVATSSEPASASATPGINFVDPSSRSGCPSPACSDILAQVAAGAKIDTVPADLTPTLQDSPKDLRLPPDGDCSDLAVSGLKSAQACTYPTGAPATAPKIVLVGDSQAWMWSVPVAAIAKQLGYGFGLVFHAGCHLPQSISASPPGKAD
jgi:hypothetical protein